MISFIWSLRYAFVEINEISFVRFPFLVVSISQIFGFRKFRKKNDPDCRMYLFFKLFAATNQSGSENIFIWCVSWKNFDKVLENRSIRAKYGVNYRLTKSFFINNLNIIRLRNCTPWISLRKPKFHLFKRKKKSASLSKGCEWKRPRRNVKSLTNKFFEIVSIKLYILSTILKSLRILLKRYVTK